MTGSAEIGDPPFRLRTRARVAAHVVWDHMTRPKALKSGDVPWAGEALTAEWLEPILCAGNPAGRITSVTIDGGSDGSSIRRRITVTYNDEGRAAGLPEQLFAKITPTLLTRLTAGLVAPTEGGFFRQIRPSLAIETPRHFWSDSDTASGRSIHIFEDIVRSKGARFNDNLTEISRSQAEHIVDLLATVHGTFHDSPRFAGDLAWLGAHENYVTSAARNGSRSGHERAMTMAAHVIPVELMARRDEIWPMLLAGLQAHQAEPRTLLHSDVHLGNWYRIGDDGMGLCDWAIVCRGHWARDFAYALSTCLSTENRRAWERDLLARYLDRMRAAGGPALAFDHAWGRYRQQLFAALIMWTPTLCHSPTRPDMQTEAMSLTMIARITAAIADLDALDSQPRN